MKATIIDMQAKNVNHQFIIENFFAKLSPSMVEDGLFVMFKLAVKAGLQDAKDGITAEEAALLFDQVNLLVDASYKLHVLNKS